MFCSFWRKVTCKPKYSHPNVWWTQCFQNYQYILRQKRAEHVNKMCHIWKYLHGHRVVDHDVGRLIVVDAVVIVPELEFAVSPDDQGLEVIPLEAGGEGWPLGEAARVPGPHPEHVRARVAILLVIQHGAVQVGNLDVIIVSQFFDWNFYLLSLTPTVSHLSPGPERRYTVSPMALTRIPNPIPHNGLPHIVEDML